MIEINKQLIDQSSAHAADADRFGLWPVYAHPIKSLNSRRPDIHLVVVVETCNSRDAATALATKLFRCDDGQVYEIDGGKLKKIGAISKVGAAAAAAAAAAANAEPKLFSGGIK